MRDLPLTLGLDTVGDDLFYTVIRLEARPETKALAAVLQKQLTAVDATDVAHRKLQRVVARAAAEAAGARLDVEDFAENLQEALLPLVKQDRTAPLFRTYLPDAVSTVLTYREAELTTWLDSAVTAFATAPEKELKALLPQATTVQAAWLKAEVAQAAAVKANGRHEESVRTPLRQDVNVARRDTYADLTKLAGKLRRKKRWVESFFRSARNAAATPPTV